MSTFIRRDIPTAIIMIFSAIMLLEFFVEWKPIDDLAKEIRTMAVVIGYGTFFIGVYYSFNSERNMIRRNPNLRQYLISGSFFTYMTIMLIVVALYGGIDAVYSDEWRWYGYKINTPQYQAMYAVMFLYQCGSLYRVCRARSLETLVLIVCGMAYILRSIPLFSGYIPGLLELGDWVAGAPTMAGTRAASITGAIGAMIVGLRGLIGKEQSTIDIR